VAARGLNPAELPEYGAEEATEGGEKSLECGGASTSAATTEARFVARDSIVEALEKRSVSVTDDDDDSGADDSGGEGGERFLSSGGVDGVVETLHLLRSFFPGGVVGGPW
jgi:hypothetical protein